MQNFIENYKALLQIKLSLTDLDSRKQMGEITELEYYKLLCDLYEDYKKLGNQAENDSISLLLNLMVNEVKIAY